MVWGQSLFISLLIRYLFLEQEGQRRKREGRFWNTASWDFLSNRLDTCVRTNKRASEMTRGGKAWKCEPPEKLGKEARASQ